MIMSKNDQLSNFHLRCYTFHIWWPYSAWNERREHLTYLYTISLLDIFSCRINHCTLSHLFIYVTMNWQEIHQSVNDGLDYEAWQNKNKNSKYRYVWVRARSHVSVYQLKLKAMRPFRRIVSECLMLTICINELYSVNKKTEGKCKAEDEHNI